MNPYLLLIYAASAFTVTFLFMPVLIKLLAQWRLYDTPGKHKIHRHFAPSMGGVCILMGAAFALLIGMPFARWTEYKFFAISIAMMFITGLRDDILTLTPRQKLIGQILPIIIVVVFGDTTLWSFYGLVWDGIVFTNPAAWTVTVFTVVILTNAYNLIDGLDGLAGTVGLIVLVCFGSWFYIVGDTSLSLISFAFAGAVAAFLYYNWEPSSIFMGDTGALVLGLLLSYLAIRFINMNYVLADANPYRFTGSIGTAVMVMIIPIFDTLRVIILRLRKMQSPFKADKNHLHHQFLKFGFSHAKTVVVIAAIQMVFIAAALALKSKPDSVILPTAVVMCFMVSIALKIAQQRQTRHGGESSIPKS